MTKMVLVQIVKNKKYWNIYPTGHFFDDNGKEYHTNTIIGFNSLNASIELKTKIQLEVEETNGILEVKKLY